MASEDPKMSKQGTDGKKKHLSLTIAQKLGIIRMLESGKSQSMVMTSYNIGVSTTYDREKQNDQL
jgi:GTPase involved in cell partitioning and DNA repair